MTADDTSALLLRLESGAFAVISASVVGIHTAGAQFEAFGEHGTIAGPLGSRTTSALQACSIEDDGLQLVDPDRRVPTHDHVIPARGAAGPIRAMALMLEDWRDGIDGGEVANAIPSFADGLLVQQAIEAARESAAGRGWVALA